MKIDFERVKYWFIDRDKVSSRGTVRVNILELVEVILVLSLLIAAKPLLMMTGLYDHNMRFGLRLITAIWFYSWLIRVSGLTKLGALIAAIIVLI